MLNHVHIGNPQTTFGLNELGVDHNSEPFEVV